MPTALITGASRGMGLEFVRALSQSGYTIFATARNPQAATDLAATGATILQLELTDSSSISGVAASLPSDLALDLLINNSGTANGSPSNTVTAAEMIDNFHTNAVGPLLLTQALLPFLSRAAAPKVVNISSRMGSIQDNTSGGYISYRTSKTALNMITKTLSVDIPNITFIALHPGYIRTAMTGMKGEMDAHESVERMLKTIHATTAGDTGKFFHRDGQTIEW
eukprot:jgi/Hompol1/846/HPOL_004550-RA